MKKGYWLLFFSFLILGFSGFLLFLAWAVDGSDGGFSLPGKDRVAVVEIRGGIFDPKEVLEELNRVYESDKLKALILRIDSPGGAVSPSQEIYDAVLRVKEKKKVIVSMGTVAASGGYYIAVAADTAGALWIATAQAGLRTGLYRAAPRTHALSAPYLAPRGAATGGVVAVGTTLVTAVRHPGSDDGASFAHPTTRWPTVAPGMPRRAS